MNIIEPVHQISELVLSEKKIIEKAIENLQKETGRNYKYSKEGFIKTIEAIEADPELYKTLSQIWVTNVNPEIVSTLLNNTINCLSELDNWIGVWSSNKETRGYLFPLVEAVMETTPVEDIIKLPFIYINENSSKLITEEFAQNIQSLYDFYGEGLESKADIADVVYNYFFKTVFDEDKNLRLTSTAQKLKLILTFAALLKFQQEFLGIYIVKLEMDKIAEDFKNAKNASEKKELMLNVMDSLDRERVLAIMQEKFGSFEKKEVVYK